VSLEEIRANLQDLWNGRQEIQNFNELSQLAERILV